MKAAADTRPAPATPGQPPAKADSPTGLEPPAGAAQDPPRLTPLWRNVPFQTLWIGSAASALGLSVADVAFPLAILAVTGSPGDAGLFAAVQTTGVILAGLPAGHLADRRSPRWMLVVAEALLAVVAVAVVLALVQGWLSLPLLLAGALVLGGAQSMTSAARILLLRTVVPKEQLTRALTQDEVRINGSDLIGPPIGGALYGLRALAHALPFVAAAASFVISLISALLVTAEPDRTPAPSSSPDEGIAMFAGLRAIWSDSMLRVTTTLLAMINFIGPGISLVAVVIMRHEGASSATIGLALGGSALGGLAGAPLVRLFHRLRPGILLLGVCGLLVPVIALLAVPLGPWWISGLMFLGMLGVPSLRVLVDVLILRQAAPAERGRIVAGVITIVAIGMPAGLLISGLLLQFLSAQLAVLVLAGLLGLGVLSGALRRQLWTARWPQLG